MSRAFVNEDGALLVVDARRAKYPAPRCIADALLDLRNEGIDQLDAIAADYNLNPLLLLRHFHGVN